MAKCKTTVSQLLTHWIYCSLASNHRNEILFGFNPACDIHPKPWDFSRLRWSFWMKFSGQQDHSKPPPVKLKENIFSIVSADGGIQCIMTSSNVNIFRVTGPIVRVIHRWPVDSPQKVQWRGAFFLWSSPQKMTEQTVETWVIWDAIAIILTSL